AQGEDLSRKKVNSFFFYPQGISATLALSAPVGLPIAKSSLEEAELKPTESVMYFWSGYP
ncbi:hypothetical protein, partial [Oceanobacillus oncorhynchi]|uniref:hypothetical protein n=1 Tax=Oceanobacillus oncorhynchi TaxID=545501 RepID=UPI0025A38ACC